MFDGVCVYCNAKHAVMPRLQARPNRRPAFGGMQRVYLDHNATTPLRHDVGLALRAAHGLRGNPGSVHAEGREAAAWVAEGRARVAALVEADPGCVVFTSGGTEADNTAIFGIARERPRGRHAVVTAVEHPAVLAPVERLRLLGWSVDVLPVDRFGRIDLADADALIREDTAFVGVMLANNEIGNVYPVAEIAEIAHARGALVHVDAVNAAGKVPIDLAILGADTLALSAHKIGGPKGVGALICGEGAALVPLLMGGGQEDGRRSGTANVGGIAGFGVAAVGAAEALDSGDVARVGALRDRLERAVLVGASEAGLRAVVLGDRESRLPNTTNIAFAEAHAADLALALDRVGVAVSAGSACSCKKGRPGHVMRAIRSPIGGGVRFSLGGGNVTAQVDYAAQATVREAQRLAVS